MTGGKQKNTIQAHLLELHACPTSLQGPPQLHQASRSAADNRIRQQNGADEYPEGPCLGTGAPWPATVNTPELLPLVGYLHVRAP